MDELSLTLERLVGGMDNYRCAARRMIGCHVEESEPLGAGATQLAWVAEFADPVPERRHIKVTDEHFARYTAALFRHAQPQQAGLPIRRDTAMVVNPTSTYRNVDLRVRARDSPSCIADVNDLHGHVRWC